jgi:hypothetical protein
MIIKGNQGHLGTSVVTGCKAIPTDTHGAVHPAESAGFDLKSVWNCPRSPPDRCWDRHNLPMQTSCRMFEGVSQGRFQEWVETGRIPALPEVSPLGAHKQKYVIYIQETWAPMSHSCSNIWEHNNVVCNSQPGFAFGVTFSEVPICLYREKAIILVNQCCRGFPGRRRSSGHQHRTRRTQRLVGRLAM